MKNRREEIQDLRQEEAIAKLKELIDHNKICMFTTHLTDVPLQVRPMAVQDVDDHGNLWFLSSEESNKNWEIHEDPRVQLLFANKGDYEFLSVYGHAEILTDRSKIEAMWNPIAKAWFKEGKDDPRLTVVRVAPEDVYYWDTKNNKAVSLMKIMASVVGNRTMDDGQEGRLQF